jgi:hypothetical protein
MNMRYSLALPVGLALACTACFSTPERPATLTFSKFAPSGYGYELTFESDTDFFASYWVRDRRPVVGRFLSCSLDDDTDFSVGHELSRFLRGNIESNGPRGTNQLTTFTYKVWLDFRETKNGGTTEQGLSRATVNKLLAGRSNIPCRVVMTIYLSKPYYSKTMQVPVTALLDKVNR